MLADFLFPELVFIELILQILYWIFEIAISSRIFILDLHIGYISVLYFNLIVRFHLSTCTLPLP
jgi:hypothetical protein